MKKILIMTILTGTFSACTIGMPKITDNTLALKVSDANQYAGTIYLRRQKYYNDFKTPGHVITGFHPTLSNEENNEVKIKIGVKYEEKINKPIPAKLPNVLKRFDSKYIGDCDPKERCNLTQENLTIVLPTAISLKIDEKKASYQQKIQQDKKALAKAEKTSCGIDTDCEANKQNLISSKKASISQAESSIAALDKEEQKKFDFKIVYEYAGFNKMNTGIHIDSYEASPDSISAYCDRKQCMITDKEGNPVNSITIKRKMTINSNRISHLIAQDKKKAEAAERERKRKFINNLPKTVSNLTTNNHNDYYSYGLDYWIEQFYKTICDVTKEKLQYSGVSVAKAKDLIYKACYVKSGDFKLISGQEAKKLGYNGNISNVSSNIYFVNKAVTSYVGIATDHPKLKTINYMYKIDIKEGEIAPLGKNADSACGALDMHQYGKMQFELKSNDYENKCAFYYYDALTYSR